MKSEDQDLQSILAELPTTGLPAGVAENILLAKQAEGQRNGSIKFEVVEPPAQEVKRFYLSLRLIAQAYEITDEGFELVKATGQRITSDAVLWLLSKECMLPDGLLTKAISAIDGQVSVVEVAEAVHFFKVEFQGHKTEMKTALISKVQATLRPPAQKKNGAWASISGILDGLTAKRNIRAVEALRESAVRHFKSKKG